MKRYDGQRLDDIERAITAIRSHLARGDLSDGLVFDAVRIRLLEIGEAVKAISPSLLATEPGIPWKNIAAMRDQLAHRYFDTEQRDRPRNRHQRPRAPPGRCPPPSSLPRSHDMTGVPRVQYGRVAGPQRLRQEGGARPNARPAVEQMWATAVP